MREHLDILALGLGDIAALLLVLSPAFLSGVIHGAAALRVLGPALLLVVSLLQESKGLLSRCNFKNVDLNPMPNTRE